MALFCIPKNQIEKLKNSALRGEVDIKQLYLMNSAQRRAFFTKYTNEELGQFINTEFEKATVSKQKNALTDWAKSVFTPKAQSGPVYKTVLDKIKSLDELGVLTPATEDAFLQDLVTDKLGIKVSPEEVRVISEKATAIDAAAEKLGNDLGNPEKLQENLDFFKAKKQMDDYLLSLNPSNQLKVLTSTIGRGMMLASVKSPLLNIGSNFEVGLTEALTRRLANGALKGTDNKLAVDYIKMVNKIYQATGYDISRMENLSDSGASGQRVMGDSDQVHAAGPGAVRKVGRFFEDVVFKQMLGAPDAAFASTHFADSVNLNSRKMAAGDPGKARAIMLDSMLVQPQTPEGELLRAQGILDAQVATWTNKTWASKLSLGIRKLFNDMTGDLRAGDYLMPFVKTPANVIATGMDYAGGGFYKALKETVKAARTGNLGDKGYRQQLSRNLVRAGFGLVAALLIAWQLDDDDFVGAYDPQRKQIEELRNSNTNSVRIGGKWISVDWFGPLAIPLSGMMYARKYGNTPGEKVFQYTKGVGSVFAKLPGVSDVADFFSSHAKTNQKLADVAKDAANFTISELTTRLIPSIISDVAKAIDKKERDTSGGTFDKTKAKIPGLRETLPVKNNIFGEPLSSEAAWSDILFGSRVKTDKENSVVAELNKVSTEADKPITFTDWSKSGSKTIAQFREKVGNEKFKQAQVEYGRTLEQKLRTLFDNSKYKNLTAEDKLQVINDADSAAMEKVFKKYNFKYKAEKKDKPKIKL